MLRLIVHSPSKSRLRWGTKCNIRRTNNKPVVLLCLRTAPPIKVLTSRSFYTSPISRMGDENNKTPSFKQDPAGWVKNLPSLIWYGIVYTWTGLKLFGLNIRTAFGLVFRLVRGHTLTRREHRLLVTTVADIFRMVPFSFFIIVPMAEFLLPVCLKLFPNMLPSTFVTAAQNEAKMQRKLKARIEMAKFMMDTAHEVNEASSPKFKLNFDEFIGGIQKGEGVSRAEVYKFVSKFKDDLTLNNLKRSQLQAMCRFLDTVPYGPTQLLRYQLRNRVDQLKADDRMIREEGLSSLTLVELKQACAARGMSSIGTRATLEALMEEWLDLSLILKVPTALLILSRAFRLMPHQTSEDLIVSSIQHLPEKVIDEVETEVELGNIEPTDVKAKYQILKEQRERVKKEKEEASKVMEHSSEVAGSVEQLRPEEKKVSEVGDFLAEMVAPCADEKQEVDHLDQNLHELRKQIGSVEVEKSISHLEKMVQSLEEEISKAELESQKLLDLDMDGKLSNEELSNTLRMAGLPENEILDFVSRLDSDHDGYVDVEHVKRLRRLDFNLDSMNSAHAVQDEAGLKKRAELHKKIRQFHKEQIQRISKNI